MFRSGIEGYKQHNFWGSSQFHPCRAEACPRMIFIPSMFKGGTGHIHDRAARHLDGYRLYYLVPTRKKALKTCGRSRRQAAGICFKGLHSGRTSSRSDKDN
ncbi:hypothetical protein CY34DRAFT_678991 [Suillus luteus UH-Slu-Lm8-n1]|uniref:Unplaced genomic scaffold CY34scaffold_717, whole genome shotgun sequence n=1 Tax=Suillus luteus UH-Slu-Lm8-n1 TaxID=930992 RepID=A0A0D0APJ7_9AGAM|nr:hypothetical protein CY34DRAFT_678991 [Suillus luteus UH-Slu-Lm8-n1]